LRTCRNTGFSQGWRPKVTAGVSLAARTGTKPNTGATLAVRLLSAANRRARRLWPEPCRCFEVVAGFETASTGSYLDLSAGGRSRCEPNTEPTHLCRRTRKAGDECWLGEPLSCALESCARPQLSSRAERSRRTCASNRPSAVFAPAYLRLRPRVQARISACGLCR